MIYVRWKLGQPREGRIFPPLALDHPLADKPCPLCGDNLSGGMSKPRDVQLLIVGAVEPDERAKAKDGDWFNALSVPLHASCLDPRRRDVVADLAAEAHAMRGNR